MIPLAPRFCAFSQRGLCGAGRDIKGRLVPEVQLLEQLRVMAQKQPTELSMACNIL